jgi:hypothetical protein
MALMQAALDYAKGNVFNEQADANIRAVRIMCNVLLQAVAQAQIRPPPSHGGPPGP